MGPFPRPAESEELPRERRPVKASPLAAMKIGDTAAKEPRIHRVAENAAAAGHGASSTPEMVISDAAKELVNLAGTLHPTFLRMHCTCVSNPHQSHPISRMKLRFLKKERGGGLQQNVEEKALEGMEVQDFLCYVDGVR
jgi:hypothetical protein